jgi:cytochrome c553
VRQIKNFKAGIRGTKSGDTYGAQMRPMAMILADDKSINDVAAYIATFK